MNRQIKKIEDSNLVEQCANLMIAHDPWKVLGFTFDKCLSALQSPRIELSGVIDDGTVLAFMATLEEGFGFDPMIEYICVDKEHQSQGSGSAFVDYAVNQLFSEQRLYLTVSDINPRAMALYIRLGFQPVGVLPDYNEPGQTEYLLQKTS